MIFSGNFFLTELIFPKYIIKANIERVNINVIKIFRKFLSFIIFLFRNGCSINRQLNKDKTKEIESKKNVAKIDNSVP